MDITPQVYSVSQFLDLVNLQLEDFTVALQGEVTSLSIRNHAYFTLSDSDQTEKAVLNCALWQSRLQSLPFELAEGVEVQLLGRANVYKPTGRFTFIVEHIAPVGEGALRRAFERLKTQLEAKGYFAEDRKRALPKFPTRIGLLTSESGEALRDFKLHLGQYGFQIAHKDVRVEGINAITSIVEGIQWFNQHPEVLPGGVEVLVLTRGGGSLESLQAFNSEEIAQAIFASKIPIISAVGHERDVTIADLVADARASTPTDAGRMLSEHWRLAADHVAHFNQLVQQSFQQLIKAQRERLRLSLEKMSDRFLSKKQEFLEKTKQLNKVSRMSFEKVLALMKQRFSSLASQVLAASPENRLRQGYSVVSNNQGKIIKDSTEVKMGERLKINLHRGLLTTTVSSKERMNGKKIN